MTAHRKTTTETLMFYWRRTGSGRMLFCELARTIWWPGRVRMPEQERETAVQGRLIP